MAFPIFTINAKTSRYHLTFTSCSFLNEFWYGFTSRTSVMASSRLWCLWRHNPTDFHEPQHKGKLNGLADHVNSGIAANLLLCGGHVGQIKMAFEGHYKRRKRECGVWCCYSKVAFPIIERGFLHNFFVAYYIPLQARLFSPLGFLPTPASVI